MNKTMRTMISNNRIIKFMVIFGLSVLLMSGCQQANNPTNSNTATNSNATANTNANSNANTAQTFKNDLLGTWIGVDDPKKKVTFAADEMTLVENGKENKLKYTRLSNDEIEVIVDGNKKKAKTTFEGDVLTIASDETVKFKRESANSNANTSVSPSNSAANTNSQASNTAAAPKEEVPLTPEAKVFKNDIVGKWKLNNGSEIIIFTENKLETPINGEKHTYRVVDEKTLELKNDANGVVWKATMKIEDNGNTLTWVNLDRGNSTKWTRVKSD